MENKTRVILWDYNNQYDVLNYNQKMWNRTLITAINLMVANINNEKILENKIMDLEFIYVPEKFKYSIFLDIESELLYHSHLKVIYIDIKSNSIKFDEEHFIQIVNYVEPIDLRVNNGNNIENDYSISNTSKGKGNRYNKGKLRYDLVEPHAHKDLVDVLTYGAENYSIRNDKGDVIYDGSMNWRNGLSWMSVLASLKRHLSSFELCDDYDIESKKLHIAHAAANIHFLNAFYYIFPQGDDRPKKYLNTYKIGLDIDGIIADFCGSWHELYPDISATPNSWYFDRDIHDKFEAMTADGTINEFYMNIKPLINSNDLPFIPHCYITSRPVSTKITEEWLKLHNFPTKPVYTVDVCNSKLNIAKTAGVDIFIDDSYDNFVDLNNGEIFTYLYTAPWNVKHNVGHMRLNNLNDLPLLK